jgi:hypothetical protein
MNANTFVGVRGYPGPVSATETAIAVINPTGGASSGYTQQTLQFGTTRQIVGLPADVAGGTHDGVPFKVRVVALTLSAVASNFTVNIYWNCGANTNLTTFTNDVLVIGTGALAVASKPAVVVTEAVLMWQSGLGQLVGFWNETTGIANVVTTPVLGKASASLTATNPIGISSTAGQTSLANSQGVQFFVTFTNSGAVTSTELVEFSLEGI